MTLVSVLLMARIFFPPCTTSPLTAQTSVITALSKGHTTVSPPANVTNTSPLDTTCPTFTFNTTSLVLLLEKTLRSVDVTVPSALT